MSSPRSRKWIIIAALTSSGASVIYSTPIAGAESSASKTNLSCHSMFDTAPTSSKQVDLPTDILSEYYHLSELINKEIKTGNKELAASLYILKRNVFQQLTKMGLLSIHDSTQFRVNQAQAADSTSSTAIPISNQETAQNKELALRPWKIHKQINDTWSMWKNEFHSEYSNDSKLILSTCNDLYANVWDANTGELKFKIGSDKFPSGDQARHGYFRKNNLEILTYNPKRLNIWSSVDGSLVKSIKSKSSIGNDDRIMDSLGGQFIAVVHSSKSKIVIYDSLTGKATTTINKITGNRIVTAFSPTGELIAVTSRSEKSSGPYDPEIHIFDTSSGKLLLSLSGHTDAINSIAFNGMISNSSDSELISGSDDHTARIWNFHKVQGSTISEINSRASNLSLLGKFVNKLSLFNRGSKNDENTFSITSRVLDTKVQPVIDVILSPDGKQAITVHGPPTVSLFDSNGKLSALNSKSAPPIIWDIQSGAEILALASQPNNGFLKYVTFSPNGQYITAIDREISTDSSQPVYIWNAQTGNIVNSIPNIKGPINSLMFSEDSSQILTSSADQTTRIWKQTGYSDE
jgi:WD40 repeat protein